MLWPGELAASSAAFGRVNAQEKVGCWCTTVEGIEAEVKAERKEAAKGWFGIF